MLIRTGYPNLQLDELLMSLSVKFNGISLQVIETRKKQMTIKVMENGAKKAIKIERFHNYCKSIT